MSPRAARWLGAMALGVALASAGLSTRPAEARPGGGQSFGGGSKSSSGSSKSWGGGSSGSGSRSSGGSSSWSWGSSKSNSGSSNWSSKPSYSSPWSTEERKPAPRPVGPHGSSSGYVYTGPSGPPSGSVGEYFFFILLGVGVLAVVVAGAAWHRRRQEREWASAVLGEDFDPERPEATAREEDDAHRHASIQAALHAYSAKDTEFSFVIFEDFLYALFAELHTLRGQRKAAVLRPYLREGVLRSVEASGRDGVTDIVIGSMKVEEVRFDEDTRRLVVSARFVANYTERTGEVAQSYFVEEVWRLSKNADSPSRAPDKARVIGCPNCGAPLEKDVGQKCKYCGTPADSDVHDWVVEEIYEAVREPRGPMLIGTTEEVGSDLPTVVAPDAPLRFEDLKKRDPAFTWAGFVARVEATFQTFYAAWSAQDLGPVRPYLSDALFETQRYWVNAYKSEKLRNVTEDARIVTTHIAKVTSDKHYDSVTVRVFASCVDYTLNAEGVVVGGNKTRAREHSEYWTFIRSAKKTGAPRTDSSCPNCGADVSKINMAGTCESCSVKVTSGDFDWVLSRIEQDEVYEG
ncbi:MAG: TIM44-like domain-containing protein [Myxococcales bacterium]|nr:TIM44-like domain-containing protein [Myxococcales bacterium]